MPSRAVVVGVSELAPTVILADDQRTVLLVQNLDTVNTDYLWVSDARGSVVASGTRIAANGGSITLRRSRGEEPEKTWYLVATTAATPARILELFGAVKKEPEEPGPQDPEAPIDAPKMKKWKHTDTGYR